MDNQFNKYIGEPLDKVKSELESKGYNVLITKNSLPKVITDYELVVLVKQIDEKLLELVVGDFLINIENKID